MRRWSLLFCMTSLLAGACLVGCDDSSVSTPDGGRGGATGAGGMAGRGGQGGTTSTGGQDASLPWRDGGIADRFTLPDLPALLDALLGVVPPCGASEQEGAACTAGPTSACVPTSGRSVCLCPTGTWMCF
jgi:hypothetical protein